MQKTATKKTNIPPSAEGLAWLLYRDEMTVDEMAGALSTRHNKTVYRILHLLHREGFDLVRRGFEATGDISYRIQKGPRGFFSRRPSLAASFRVKA